MRVSGFRLGWFCFNPAWRSGSSASAIVGTGTCGVMYEGCREDWFRGSRPQGLRVSAVNIGTYGIPKPYTP